MEQGSWQVDGQAAQQTILYNPLTPEFRQNPYPDYERLRTQDPVHWAPYACCWVLTRYADCKFVLADKRFGIKLDWMMQIEALKETFAEPFNQIIRTQLLSSDPPDHKRIRGVMKKSFGPSGVESMRARITATAERMLNELKPRGQMDFIKDFAYPYPFHVICDLLNVPDSERAPLEGFTHGLMRTTDPTPMTPAENTCANDSAIGFKEFFLSLAEHRRRKPIKDVFTTMVQAVDAGVVAEEEFVANMILLFCAGHDTVVNLFGNGLLALHRFPDQLALLKSDPSLARSAVEELLRYDTSVQIARRTATEDVDLGDRRILCGQYILCMLGAANRDPEAFPDPDRLDITRKDAKTMSFGGGIHYCLGAGLARLEGEVVFSALMRILPELRLDTLEPSFHQNVFVRGLESLPASW